MKLKSKNNSIAIITLSMNLMQVFRSNSCIISNKLFNHKILSISPNTHNLKDLT